MKQVEQGNRWGERVCGVDTCDVFLSFHDVFCSACLRRHACGHLNRLETLFFQTNDEEQAIDTVRQCVNGPCGYKGRRRR